MPAGDADFRLAMEAALEAGRIAMRYFGKHPEWHRKADHSPVSEADLAVDEALRKRLRHARPDYGWLSEETADSEERLSCRRVWVLDPVDGTSGFLRGDPDWCVSLALVEDGRPVIGIIHAPARGHTWAAMAGQGAALDDRPIRVSDLRRLEGAHLIGPRSIHDRRMWDKPWPEVKVTKLPSLALRLAHVASAEADGMLAPGCKCDWDIAAGDVIVREAGGVVTDARGETILYNRRETRPFGVVAANAELHAQIMEYVRTYRGHGRHRHHPRGERRQ